MILATAIIVIAILIGLLKGIEQTEVKGKKTDARIFPGSGVVLLYWSKCHFLNGWPRAAGRRTYETGHFDFASGEERRRMGTDAICIGMQGSRIPAELYRLG